MNLLTLTHGVSSTDYEIEKKSVTFFSVIVLVIHRDGLLFEPLLLFALVAVTYVACWFALL